MDKNKKNQIKIKINKKSYLLVLLLSVFLFVVKVEAATIYPSPSTGTYNVGASFSIGVFVSSADQAMNAVSGVLSFPSDKLEVASISKGSSVINLWVQEPSYSNGNGTVNFEGVVLNPGYKGSAGRVITVNFIAKSAGTAKISLSSGSVLANDGQGTSILDGLGSASIVVNAPASESVPTENITPPPVVTNNTLAAPQIYSATHPDQNAWYNINIPSFNWDLPSGAVATRLLVGQNPQANPTVNYSPAISEKVLSQLEDGVWYFHVQLRNSAGWGGVSHFRFQIDTKNPDSLTMGLQEEDDPSNPTRVFLLDAQDSGSGIEYYEIQIDDNNVIKWQNDSNGLYTTPVLSAGEHTIIVKAIDRAGNLLTETREFTIESLDAPRITKYPKELTTDELLVVTGTTYPRSRVVIWLENESKQTKSYNVKADELGEFNFISDEKISGGVYKLWAEVIGENGAKSLSSDKYSIIISSARLNKIGTITISALSVIVPLVALLFLLFFIVWYSLLKLKLLRCRLNKEASEVETTLHKEFKSLKRRLNLYITRIERAGNKRKLTREEEIMITQLRRELDFVEKRLTKEIGDIRKGLK